MPPADTCQRDSVKVKSQVNLDIESRAADWRGWLDHRLRSSRSPAIPVVALAGDRRAAAPAVAGKGLPSALSLAPSPVRPERAVRPRRTAQSRMTTRARRCRTARVGVACRSDRRQADHGHPDEVAAAGAGVGAAGEAFGHGGSDLDHQPVLVFVVHVGERRPVAAGCRRTARWRP